MADLRKHSSTSNIIRLVLKKKSDGTAFTGLAYNTSGLRLSVICNNEAAGTTYVVGPGILDITTLGTWADPGANSIRFKEVSGTNHPGLYEIHILNSRFSVANAKSMVVTVTGVTDLLTADYEIALTGFDPFDAVALGLSRLDAAITTRMATFTLPGNFALLGINGSGHISRVSVVDLLTAIDTDGITAAALSAAAAAKIEAALLNEGDGQMLIDAIIQAIDAADIDTDILPGLVRDAILNRVLAGNHDTAGTVGKLLQNINTAAGTDLPADIAALNDLDAAGVRAAVGMASADLDAQLALLATAASIAALNDLDAAGVRAAVGLTSANLEALITACATAAKLLKYVQLLARGDAATKADNAAELAEINADGGSGAGGYDNETDAQEPIRNALAGGGGGGGTNVSVKQSSLTIKGSSS